jgi:hypothetical protein
MEVEPMALKLGKTREAKPLAKMSDPELQEQVRTAEAVVAEAVESVSSVVRDSKRREEALAARDTILAAKEETAKRRARRETVFAEEARVRRGREHPAGGVLRAMSASEFLDPLRKPRQELAIDPSKLSKTEGAELAELWGKRRRDELDADGLARLEKLAGIACGSPTAFADARAEAAVRAEAERLAEEWRLHEIPERPLLLERGAVQFPQECFAWLRLSNDGRWTLGSIAVLYLLLASFDHQDASLIRAATGTPRIEQDDGEPVLKWSGERQDLRLAPGIDDLGGTTLAAALTSLRINRWIEIGRGEDGSGWIRRGERALALQGRAEPTATATS